jgi:hypothetical protein
MRHRQDDANSAQYNRDSWDEVDDLFAELGKQSESFSPSQFSTALAE